VRVVAGGIGVRLVARDKEDVIGLANGFAAERRKAGVGEIEHVFVARFLLVKPTRDGFEIVLALVREDSRKLLGINR
jgi:hypothetical protein